MAIASLVLGILGCTSIVGLVLGIIALGKIKESRGGLAGRGLAIAGMYLPPFHYATRREIGGPCRGRTYDLLIKSQLLYQLS